MHGHDLLQRATINFLTSKLTPFGNKLIALRLCAVSLDTFPLNFQNRSKGIFPHQQISWKNESKGSRKKKERKKNKNLSFFSSRKNSAAAKWPFLTPSDKMKRPVLTFFHLHSWKKGTQKQEEEKEGPHIGSKASNTIMSYCRVSQLPLHYWG